MHRDLNDIIPPSRRRAMDLGQNAAAPQPPAGPSMDMRPAAPPPPRPPVEHEVVAPMPRPPKPPRFPRIGGSRKFPLGTALIALVVVALCAGVLYAFQGAKVAVSPVMNQASIQTELLATAGQGELPFQVVTVEKTANASVPAESTVTAADPASGKITITNRQTAAQALIKNTRFETPDGLVFRIRDSVSIPAGGSITVTVYADEAGDRYNIGATTFTVPGLKGSAAYTQVTAKSDAAMTGGFSGTRPSVGQATKDKQYAEIQSKLSGELTKELTAKIPEGYVLVPGASVTTYTPQTDAAGASGTVTLSETGTIRAVVFPAGALARAIALKSLGSYTGQDVTLADVSGLTLTPAEVNVAPDAAEYRFTLSGSTTIIWVVDPIKVAGAVAGKTRGEAEIGLKSFPEVDRATLVLRPFWTSRFPADPEKIKVTVGGPTGGK